MERFKRLWITENPDGSFSHDFIESQISELPTNELLIKVKYSSLNYKDALSAKGNKGVTKNYPHTPGIDAAGEVLKSSHTNFKIGDLVIVTGFDLGMNTLGGLSEYISVPAAWAVKLPKNLSLKEAMIIGTAGLTAAMCIDKLIFSGTTKGKILVSGASGGVGSMAIVLLKKLGFEPIALSRKENSRDFLVKIGATEIINTTIISDKPVLKPLYEGAIDTVGGEILSNIIKQIKPNGAISVCGMAQSSNFQSSVFPFIIRGLSMFGIDSAEAPIKWRNELWHKLANEWKIEDLESISKMISLENVWTEIELLIKGEQTGRIVVEIS